MAAKAAIHVFTTVTKATIFVMTSQMTLRANLTIGPDGSLELPANMRAELGLKRGGKLLARLENGSLVLEPIDAAVRRAQAMVRKFVPDNANIIEEFIAERRVEAERE
jgi:antitoxin component of MazEF toxin-antitoxin module